MASSVRSLWAVSFHISVLGARAVSINPFSPTYGDVSLEKFSLKQLFTVATTCSKTCFFCFTSGDSTSACPWYSSACSNIWPSRILLNTIFPSSPRVLCSKMRQCPRWSYPLDAVTPDGKSSGRNCFKPGLRRFPSASHYNSAWRCFACPNPLSPVFIC